MSDFACHGGGYQALILGHEIQEDEGSGFPFLSVQIRLLKEATDPNTLGRDASWADVKNEDGSPVDKEALFPLSANKEGSKLMNLLFKSIGFHGTIADLLDPDTEFSCTGRTVIAVCDKLPDDYDPASPLPPERWRFLWALSSGKRRTASKEARKAAAERLRKKDDGSDFVPPGADIPPSDAPDVPF